MRRRKSGVSEGKSLSDRPVAIDSRSGVCWNDPGHWLAYRYACARSHSPYLRTLGN